ncbi:hypothetical protein TG4357_02614 [Thalassovita gelatinovora]|uniref:DUF2147 domain-containing protein n=1 Tax=Thalassovita gelatinovora TaxID=53501 RepID=A0A0P1G3A7_THAGE|nr:DUF2147 domain-containing protein [Thalassovita gelatinovora]QIZ79743.1 DUF2147 domain-containing protein [Thalassovita gelatinovora]CUH66745.1 hypothetical protein TG4357_02614 [Thalassovita gelatinovora]SEQ42061.1 Uncharacterized conserved protein, DUF2147 family [Thalassovita gelatinovora]
MKKLVLAAVLSLAGAGAALADPVEGIWKTQVDDGSYAHITMSTCGDSYCGVISRTFNASGEYKSANVGKKLVWDMKPQGNGSYKKGKIWQPSTDKIYSSKMSLKGNVLNVSGCVGPICKKQTWNRVE